MCCKFAVCDLSVVENGSERFNYVKVNVCAFETCSFGGASSLLLPTRHPANGRLLPPHPNPQNTRLSSGYTTLDKVNFVTQTKREYTKGKRNFL